MEKLDLDSVKELNIIASHNFIGFDKASLDNVMDYLSIPELKKRYIIIIGSCSYGGKLLMDFYSKRPEEFVLLGFDRLNGEEGRISIDIIKRGHIDEVFFFAKTEGKDVNQQRRDEIDLFSGVALSCHRTGTLFRYYKDPIPLGFHKLSQGYQDEFVKMYCPEAKPIYKKDLLEYVK